MIQLTCCRLCYAKSIGGGDGDQLMEIATIIGVVSNESGLLQPEWPVGAGVNGCLNAYDVKPTMVGGYL